MTPLISDTDEVKIEAVANSLLQKLFGLVIMAGGAALAYGDYQTAMAAKERLHTSHISLAVGVFVFGALVGFTRFTAPVVDKLWIYVGQTSLPLIGGRRASDPPAPKREGEK